VARTASFIHLANVRVEAEVAVYFYGGLDRYYQLQEWLGPLRALNEQHRVAFVVRSLDVWIRLKADVQMPVVYCRTLGQLMEVYQQHEFKCILYVNHGVKNFQSLIMSNAVHVHINHGESEKSCMHSNQAKAYDFVLVSSEAAVERYRRNLLAFDPKKFLQIGRPQLDFYEPEARRVPSDVTTVLYAPTWRATHESMDYSSVTRFGLTIAQAFVNREGYYFIYRPHPSTGTTSAAEATANRQITDMVTSATNAELHRARDIGGVFAAVDAAIFDNSSVAVDFLRADKPMFITRVGALAEADVTEMSEKRFCTRDTERVDAAPILAAAVALEPSQAERVADMVLQEIRDDTLRERRRVVGRYYLGNSRPGESTQKFILTVEQLAVLRDKLCAERETLRSEPVTVSGGTV
jgi:hypothetical protein